MCIECFKVPVMYGRIILLSMAWFSLSHLRRITNIFLQIFSGLQVFLIFKPVNSTFINTFKVIKKIFAPSSSLDIWITIKVMNKNQVHCGFQG